MSEHSREATWRISINADRKGAGYFTSQAGVLCFNPMKYIEFRAVNRDQSSCLIDEWTRWISEFKKCQDGGVRRAASAALPLTQQDLAEYYCTRIFTDRELDIMDGSSQQYKIADQQFILHLKGRQKVGTFVIPKTTAMIPALFATIPTLLVAKADIQKICNRDVNGLKRSWGYGDLKNVKTRLI
ncbi:hypothetical protein BGZ49_004433 [Haplosporangium sp. Z 27]|nr:hypothetical protein BGZ49_004433 [Haplosporangium sp. Z 27]